MAVRPSISGRRASRDAVDHADVFEESNHARRHSSQI
jgi:hypothetical protein